MSVPNATKSAENKISLPDIEGTREGRLSVFSHGEPHFTFCPNQFPSHPSLQPSPSLHLYCCPTTGWHVWQIVCTMSACPFTQTRDPSWKRSMCDVQTGFSFWDLDVYVFGALTHCFPPVRSNQTRGLRISRNSR